MAETIDVPVEGWQEPTSPDEFIRHHITVAEQMWSARRGREVLVRLGRLVMAVRFIGVELQEVILPVLQHAVTAGHAMPDTIVYAVACDEAGFAEPPDEWPFPLDTPAAQLRTHWNPDDGPVLSSDESRGIWHLHDVSRQVGLYWVKTVRDLPYWEYGSALRHHIFWGSVARNQGILHSAVISNGDQGAMLAGPGGSGKSTLTAAAMQSGWRTTGDDFVVVSNPESPVSHRLFDVLKLTGMAEEMFSELASRALNPDRSADEKAIIRMSNVHPECFVKYLPVSVILSARLSHLPKSRIVPASRLQLVQALVPTTASLLRTGLEDIFSFSSALLRSLPCFEFQIGSDPFEALEVLDAFLREME